MRKPMVRGREAGAPITPDVAAHGRWMAVALKEHAAPRVPRLGGNCRLSAEGCGLWVFGSRSHRRTHLLKPHDLRLFQHFERIYIAVFLVRDEAHPTERACTKGDPEVEHVEVAFSLDIRLDGQACEWCANGERTPNSCARVCLFASACLRLHVSASVWEGSHECRRPLDAAIAAHRDVTDRSRRAPISGQQSSASPLAEHQWRSSRTSWGLF